MDTLSLDDFLKKSLRADNQGLPGLMDLARWAIQQKLENHIRLKEPQAGKRPKLTEDLFEPGQLDSIRRDFAGGKPLAFYLPVAVLSAKAARVAHTGFSVFLERDENLDKPQDHFIRQGITIPEVSSLKHKGIRAIVSITDSELSSFLGDAENPAHTQWERNSKKFKSKYKLGPATLDFVKSSPRELVKILTQPQRGRDENLLRHIFSVPAAAAGENAGKPVKGTTAGGEKGFADGAIVDLEPGSYLQLSAVRGGGGFRLKRRPHSVKIPHFITVWVAYEVRGGNPFKKYTPLDFDLSQKPIQIEVHGARLLLCKENTIQIEVVRGDFRLTVIGFDTRRDIRVRTHP